MGGKNETTPRTVLITGASRGIGAACARRFAAAGDRVVVNYHRSEAAAQALVEEIRSAGGTAAAIRADVGDPEQVRAMVDNVLEKFCQLDILICNAGVAKQQLFTDITDQDWRGIFRTDVDGVFYACRAVLPHFIHRKAGSIVTLSSMWGVTGGSCEVAYSATKGGINSFTRALAKELAPSNVQVNAVACGAIDTDMNHFLEKEELEALKEEIPAGRLAKPEEVAQLLLQLARSDSYLTGQIIGFDGGWI